MKCCILVIIIAAIGQIASGKDTCPYAVAPDFTTYDLSSIAYRTLQYSEYKNGVDYTYNISLCGIASQSCGASFGSAGVCSYWNKPWPMSTCYGEVYARKVIGLNNGAGVQILYRNGDFCGSCNPSGPLNSVITLTCDSVTPSGQVWWTSVQGVQPGMPPVVYFNGTMNCNILPGRPVSAPYPTSTPSASWTGCRSINAPDGSTYDLSALMDRDFSTVIYSSDDQQYSNTSFAVCGGISGFCGNGACRAWRSASVCQLYEPLDVEKCFGQYNLDTTMEGLNFGEGVIITYNDGDKCDGCTPQGPRKTILTLTCISYYFPSELYVTSASTDLLSSILTINANIGCTPATTPQSSPQTAPQPWWGPQPYWTPQSNQRPPYVTIQYIGYGTGCNGSDAYIVTVNRTWSCYPGCYLQGNKYVMTACDDDIFLPRDGTWVETIYYGDSYYCGTPQSAAYARSHTCTGNFNFSYQECDPNTVYTYTCNSPYCNQCSIASKTFTETCNSGTLYRCVSDFSKFHNPLL